jgi:hypothetical protein
MRETSHGLLPASEIVPKELKAASNGLQVELVDVDIPKFSIVAQLSGCMIATHSTWSGGQKSLG